MIRTMIMMYINIFQIKMKKIRKIQRFKKLPTINQILLKIIIIIIIILGTLLLQHHQINKVIKWKLWTSEKSVLKNLSQIKTFLQNKIILPVQVIEKKILQNKGLKASLGPLRFNKEMIIKIKMIKQRVKIIKIKMMLVQSRKLKATQQRLKINKIKTSQLKDKDKI